MGSLPNISLFELMGRIVQAASEKVMWQIKQKTDNNFLPADLTADDINYDYGTWKQIGDKLHNWGTNKDLAGKKFPLICIPTNEPTEVSGANDFKTIKIPAIIIAINSDPNDNAFNQQLKYYKDVLYPIYDAFIYQIWKSPYFRIRNPYSEIKHSKKDMVYNGIRETLFTDYMCAVRIENLTVIGQNEIF